MQPSEAVDKIHSSFPPSLLSKYSWGIRKKAGLPYGFIFLKRKKQWQKGRTLISYFQSFQGKLLKAVSKALDSMLQQQWTQTAGQLSTSQIWKKIHSFLQDTPAEIMLGCINDDLIGFFNSVPQERLVQAVSDVVQQWRQTHVGDAISVDIQQQGHVVATTFAGSYKKQAAHIKTIRIDDIFPIVQKPLLDHTLFYCPQPSVASNPGSRDWESYRSYYFKSCRNHGRTQLARNVFPNFKCSQFDYSVR